MRRVFGHGGLRLFLLMLLDEQPQHGYDLIKMVEDRFLGMYTPSAGTVYPRLQSLEDEGLVEHEEVDGRKVYRLTEAGRRELEERRSELDELQRRAVESARHLAGAIREEVRDSVREMREDLKHAMKDVKREERWAARQARAAAGDAFRHGRRSARRERPGGSADQWAEAWSEWPGSSGGGGDPEAGGARLELRVLRSDLEAFVEDVVSAARDNGLDRAGLGRAREALLDARDTLVAVLRGAAPAAPADTGQGGPGPEGGGEGPGPEDGGEHWA